MFLSKKNSFIKTNGRKIQSKKVEGVSLDSYYFTEYGIEYWYIIKNSFNKVNRWDKLMKDLDDSSISIRLKWLVAVACALWHVLDKVYNIFISKRDKASYYTITTEDWFSIEVTEWLEILTEAWYKPAKLITDKDSVMTMVGSTFWFRNSWWSKSNFIDSNSILNDIWEKFKKEKYLYLKDLTEKEKKLVYLLWFKIDKDRRLLYSEFLSAQKFFWEKKNKKKIEGDKDSSIENWEDDIDFPSREQSKLDWILRYSDEPHFQYKKVIEVKREDKSNIMVYNINTTVAENIIINNFIIRQNC